MNPQLGQAIINVQSAEATLADAESKRVNAQSQYEAALAEKNSADTANGVAVVDFNRALDELIDAASSAKLEILAV